jgi:GTPase SAR1 family protein
MGVCGSSELTPAQQAAKDAEKKKSKQIEAGLHNDHYADLKVNKLLLLGSGESGKSTLFKQMITIYGKGFSDDEKRGYVTIVWKNVIEAMKVLCQQSIGYGDVSAGNQSARTAFTEMKGEEDLTPELGRAIQSLWKEPAIQAAYEKRSTFQLPDSAKYFFEKVEQVAKKDYIPDKDDILRARVRTTGIVENNFVIDGNNFQLFDVGGQRNERKKWIHCFESVTAVLFVAAISEYDQTCFEDETTNRMTEALTLFDEIANSRWFQKTSIILFLNKKDLFREKILRVPLNVAFPDYQGKNEPDEAIRYITTQFEAQSKNPAKTVYTHVTCATDTTNVHAVFNAVKDIIIRQSLNEAGLLTESK